MKCRDSLGERVKTDASTRLTISSSRDQFQAYSIFQGFQKYFSVIPLLSTHAENEDRLVDLFDRKLVR